MKAAEEGGLSSELLSGLLSAAGIPVPAGATEKLALHANEMLRWNRAIRLTAITAPAEVAVKHIIDSLLLHFFAPFAGRTLDFGSGAGYPGIPLAVAFPEARVVLFESSAKKCAFLSHACALLGLRNADVVRGRLEARNPHPAGRFEQIVTRATLRPPEAARLLGPCLMPEGRLLLMTGPAGARRSTSRGSEAEAPFSGLREGRRRTFTLPLEMGTREIRELLSGDPGGERQSGRSRGAQ